MPIVWNEAIPSDTSKVGNAPKDFPSVWTSISIGLASGGLYWNGSGGGSDASTGDLKPGATRAYIGTRSQSSAANSQATGRLFFCSDTSQLLLYDSGATVQVLSPRSIEIGSSVSLNNTWLRQSGSVRTTAAGASFSTVVVFPTPFTTTPSVQVASGGTCYITVASSIATNSFVLSATSTLVGPSAFTAWWWAVGQVAQA